MELPPVVVAALYFFAKLDDYADKQAPLKALCEEEEVRGTILLAAEGVNGTIAGSRHGVATVLSFLRSDPRLADMAHKESFAEEIPFRKLKVRLKKEIVTLGQPDVDPVHRVGTYVKPRDWNAFVEDPDVIVIDTRNTYETRVGSFKGAVDPKTPSFRDFPQWAKDNLSPDSHPKVAMFCTGGIRCEKASSWMLGQGYENVYHLEGGILKYLEDVPAEDSTFEGECFVFDSRVSVVHGLELGSFSRCYACGNPLSPEDLKHPDFKVDEWCPYCDD